MHRILLSFLSPALSVFTFTTIAKAQSAQEVVNHYIEALGGKEKLQSLNSVYLEGLAVLPNGEEIHTRSWRVYDRLYRQEIDFGVGKIVIIVTPRQGWTANPATGGVFKALPPDQLKALQTEIDPAGPLVDYNTRGNKIEYAGTDTVDGNACARVKVFFPSNQWVLYSIDQKSWYILREIRHGGAMMGGGASGGGWQGNSGNAHGAGDDQVDIRFSDYRNTRGGYIFPFSITISGLAAEIKIQKIDINGNVDVDGLSRPK
jgi:hypothetical protein